MVSLTNSPTFDDASLAFFQTTMDNLLTAADAAHVGHAVILSIVGSGLGSALLGSVGPLTAPFFLAYGLTRTAYIGTEAASALTMHLSKIAAYGAGDLLTGRVLLYGAALIPATLLGTWIGKKIVGRISDHAFVILVEIGLLAAGVLFLVGL